MPPSLLMTPSRIASDFVSVCAEKRGRPGLRHDHVDGDRIGRHRGPGGNRGGDECESDQREKRAHHTVSRAKDDFIFGRGSRDFFSRPFPGG